MIQNGFLKMALIAVAACFCLSATSAMASRTEIAQNNGNGCAQCGKECSSCQKPPEPCKPCKTCPEKKKCEPCKTCPEKKKCESKCCPPEKKCEPCPCPASCDKPCSSDGNGSSSNRKGAAKAAVGN